MMDDSERVMIKYQKCNVICLSSESEGSSSDGGGKDEIPKLFHKNKLTHQTEVDNFMVIFVRLLFRKNIKRRNGQRKTTIYLMEYTVGRP